MISPAAPSPAAVPTKLEMYYNPPAPFPKHGLHRIDVRFDAGAGVPTIDSVHVERGKVTYVTTSTNWNFERGDSDPNGFATRLDARTADLVAAVRQLLTSAPTGTTRSWPQNNDFTVRLGEGGNGGVWEGKLVGSSDAADAVAGILAEIADDAKRSLPAHTEGPG